MPRHCSVYGCRSNYDSESDHVSTFSLPKDPELNQRWLRKIPTDLTRLKHPVICIKHFHESLIIRSDIVQYKGEIKEYPRERPKLRDGAVPTIFPNTSSYLSEPVSTVTRLADVEEARLQEAVKNSLADHAAYEIHNHSLITKVSDDAIATETKKSLKTKVNAGTMATETKNSLVTKVCDDAIATETKNSLITEMSGDAIATEIKNSLIPEVSDDPIATEIRNSLITEVNDDAIATETKNSLITEVRDDAIATEIRNSLVTEVSINAIAAETKNSLITEVSEDEIATETKNSLITEVSDDAIATETKNALITKVTDDVIATQNKNSFVTEVSDDAIATAIKNSLITEVSGNAIATETKNSLITEVSDNAIATETKNSLITEVSDDAIATETKNALITKVTDDVIATQNKNSLITEVSGDAIATEIKNSLITEVSGNAIATEIKNSLITEVSDDAIAAEVNNSFMTKVKIDVSAAKDSLLTGINEAVFAETVKDSHLTEVGADVFAATGDSFVAGKNIAFTAKENELLDRTTLLHLQKFETSENETAEKELDSSEAFQKLCLTFFAEQQCGEEKLQEDIKTLEKLSREIASILYQVKMMQCTNSSVICEQARKLFLEVQKTYASLAQKVSREQYFNFNRLWKSVTQHLVAQAAFLKYIESEEFLSKTEAAEILGVVEDSTEGFHLYLPDYLMGVSKYPKELVHLSMRYAIRGQPEKCVDILNFIADLKCGFKRLNLKNNQLRRSYDGLKYQKKKAATIVEGLKKHGHLNSEEANLTCFDSDD